MPNTIRDKYIWSAEWLATVKQFASDRRGLFGCVIVEVDGLESTKDTPIERQYPSLAGPKRWCECLEPENYWKIDIIFGPIPEINISVYSALAR